MKRKKRVFLRSSLEDYCKKRLEEEGIPYTYESWKVTLFPAFRYEGFCLEQKGKTPRKAVIAITYTPDFVGSNWIIETKGFRTEEFNLKWKMFKKYLLDNKLAYDLYMPANNKEIDSCIEIIKTKLNGAG